jgi:hypothetical protein
MRVRFRKYGGPEVLEVAEVAGPVPGDGQVLVRVKAAGSFFVHLGLGQQGRSSPGTAATRIGALLIAAKARSVSWPACSPTPWWPRSSPAAGGAMAAKRC